MPRVLSAFSNVFAPQVLESASAVSSMVRSAGSNSARTDLTRHVRARSFGDSPSST